jgi:hypothetical protein
LNANISCIGREYPYSAFCELVPGVSLEREGR